MKLEQNWGGHLTRIGYSLVAIAALGLAYLCLHGATFAYDWEPVPPHWPGQVRLAYASAAGLAIMGILLASPRHSRIGATGFAIILFAWVVVLHLPKVFGGAEAAWIAMFECVAVASGLLLTLAAGWSSPARRDHIGQFATLAFGASLISFGFAHFHYVAATAGMVPSWLPARSFWAYATGAAHVAAGISIATRRLDRLAAPLLSIMFAAFTLLVNLPQAAASMTLGAAAAGLCFATGLTGSALLVTASVLTRRTVSPLIAAE